MRAEEKFTKQVTEQLESAGFRTEENVMGLVIKGSFDKWVLDIYSVRGDRAQVKLFHYNVMKLTNYNKGKLYGDLHKQFEGTCTVDAICRYIITHDSKYNRASRGRRTCTV